LKRAFWIVSIVMVLAGAAFGRPDLNAFLNHNVETTAELVAQVKRDPEVADRFMRHYGMTKAELIAFLSTLHVDTIKQEGIYGVYSVPEGGKIRLNLQHLKKGHRIFARPDGTPELIHLCANPMSLGPKQVIALNRTPVTSTEVVADEVPMQIMTEVSPEFEPLAAISPGEPTYTFATPEETPIPIPISGGFNLLPLALGGLAFLDHGGGNPPVPEPMTMAAFGVGVALLGLRRRTAKK
jgi:hypothetical protein